MVKVCNVLSREGENGPFAVLELSGELEMVQSSNTGRFYATVRKCTIPCTLEIEEAKAFIGTKMLGSIQKVECEPYEFTVPGTAEVVELSHRWEFVPEMAAIPSTAPVIEMHSSKEAA